MLNLLDAITERIIAYQFNHDMKEMEDCTMTYRLMKRLIEQAKKKGTISTEKENILLKLDVFLMADRITAEEYQELVALMEEGGENE